MLRKAGWAYRKSLDRLSFEKDAREANQAMTKNEEVYRDLRERILSGSYSPWSAIENEAVLCKRYGVSRPTLQKAIAHLKQDGLVHSRQGSGVFVNPPEFCEQYNMRSFTERYRDTGRKVSTRVLTCETVPCGEHADLFHLDPDEPLIHYVRLRSLDGRPYLLDDTYMPKYLFKDFDEGALQGSMLDYMENVCGYTISHSLRDVRAIVADEWLASTLDIEQGKPLLEVNQTIYLTRNILIQFTREVSLDEDIKILSVR
jgi:DNA-binding GntR family transcriptional regulator